MKLALLQLLKLVKGKKIQVEGERLFKCGVCKWGPLHLYLYMLGVGLARDKLGNHVEPPLHGINEPPEKSGAERRWGRCGRTPLPAPSRHRLRLVGLLVGLERSHGGVLPKFVGWMGRLLIPCHRICFMLCLKAHFDYNSIVSKYKCCKIEVLQYKWNYVNCKGICV